MPVSSCSRSKLEMKTVATELVEGFFKKEIFLEVIVVRDKYQQKIWLVLQIKMIN